MRPVIAWIAAIVAGILAPLALVGFWADRTLDDPRPYVQAMGEAWQDPQLREEVGESMLDIAEGDLDDLLSDNLGGLAGLFRITPEFVQSLQPQFEEALNSTAFEQAWLRWHWNLHGDLAEYARGGTPDTTVVGSQSLTVDVGPLIIPIVSETIGSFAAGFIEGLEVLVEVETEPGLDQQLLLLGGVADWRWGFLLAAIAMGYLAWRLLPGRARALGTVLIAVGIGSVVFGLLFPLAAALGQEPAEATLFAETAEGALTSGMPGWLFIMAAITGIAGVLLTVSARRAPDLESA